MPRYSITIPGGVRDLEAIHDNLSRLTPEARLDVLHQLAAVMDPIDDMSVSTPDPRKNLCMFGRWGANSTGWRVWAEQPGGPSYDDPFVPAVAPVMRVHRDGVEVLRIRLRRNGPARPGWTRIQDVLGAEAEELVPLVLHVGRLAAGWPAERIDRPAEYTVEVEVAAEAPVEAVRTQVIEVLRGLFAEVSP